jgi:tRNA wybutosine-synthesizing protein 2
MLRAPRIREGPRKGDRQYQNPPDDSEPHPGSNEGRFSKRANFRNEMENWENTTCANLSFQDLGDDFQQENFLTTLRKLVRCEQLQLIDNSLTDLSSVSLPR